MSAKRDACQTRDFGLAFSKIAIPLMFNFNATLMKLWLF